MCPAEAVDCKIRKVCSQPRNFIDRGSTCSEYMSLCKATYNVDLKWIGGLPKGNCSKAQHDPDGKEEDEAKCRCLNDCIYACENSCVADRWCKWSDGVCKTRTGRKSSRICPTSLVPSPTLRPTWPPTLRPTRRPTGVYDGRLSCFPGYVLAGFEGRRGSYFDRLIPLCVNVTHPSGLITGQGVVGGFGGESFEASLTCPAGFAVRSIDSWKLYWHQPTAIGAIRLYCQSIANSSVVELFHQGDPRLLPVNATHSYSCAPPNGYVQSVTMDIIQVPSVYVGVMLAASCASY